MLGLNKLITHMSSLLFKSSSMLTGHACSLFHQLMCPLGFLWLHCKGCICIWIHQYFMLPYKVVGPNMALCPENIQGLPSWTLCPITCKKRKRCGGNVHVVIWHNLHYMPSSVQIEAGKNLITDHSHTVTNWATGRTCLCDLST